MKWWLCTLLAACSSKTASTPHGPDDGVIARPPLDARAAPPGPYRVDAKAPHGDVQIRVEWKDVPVVARASPGRTSCGTAKPASVAPTTTWGIPDAVVMIEVEHGVELAPAPARIVLEHCALSPRIALASSLVVASAMDAPAQVAFARVGSARPLAAPTKAASEAIARLPVIGHEVELPIEPSSLVAVTSAEDEALVIAAPTPYYAITEANGQVVLRDVPVGTFEVSALLPARGGQPARTAKGTVTVVAGALAEVVLSL
ncbi:MAG: hypothetical protein ABI591_12210 [Kofleriaceae bacterium]